MTFLEIAIIFTIAMALGFPGGAFGQCLQQKQLQKAICTGLGNNIATGQSYVKKLKNCLQEEVKSIFFPDLTVSQRHRIVKWKFI